MSTPTSRRQFLRGSLAAGALLGAGGILAACGDDDDTAGTGTGTGTGDGSTTSTARRLVTLEAMMPFPLFLAFIADVAAQSGGFMADEGIDLDIEFARSAPQALQQLAAGNVTVIRNAPLAVARAVATEAAPFVSIGMVNQNILYVLVSTPDAPVDTLDALAGKTVGMATLGGNAEDTFNLVLRSAGLDPAAIGREAVGNEAQALALVEEGRVDALFATRESTASMRSAGLEPHVAEIPDANPLLGTNLVTTRENVTAERDSLVRYIRGLHAAMEALNDEERLRELIPRVRADWELPQLDNPDSAVPVIQTIASMWYAAGEENLLRNVPERWEEGVAGFARLKIIPEGSDPASFYTNELWEEAVG